MGKENLNDIEQCEDLTEEETKVSVKEEGTASASTDFEKVIKNYLDEYSLTDNYFNKKYSDESKSIRNCCNYIINKVQKMGVVGLTDDEVYQMARHYYLEDIKEEDLKSRSCKVVVNKSIEAGTPKQTKKTIVDKAKENGQLDIFSMLGE